MRQLTTVLLAAAPGTISLAPAVAGVLVLLRLITLRWLRNELLYGTSIPAACRNVFELARPPSPAERAAPPSTH
jgi:hypothetical protein